MASKRLGVALICACAAGVGSLMAWAAQARENDAPQAPAVESGASQASEEGAAAGRPPASIEYVPPNRGQPGGRIGGGTRSAATECDARIEALVPESHVGLTERAQPVLQWYLSARSGCRVDFVLNDPRKPQPLIEKTLTGPFGPGIHAIDLSGMGVELEPGVEYQWSIALVRDPERRSHDAVAGGPVMHRSPSTPGSAGSAGELARRYAAEGFWYDALAVLSAGIAAEPDSAELHALRAELLDQVGLAEVTAGDRSR